MSDHGTTTSAESGAVTTGDQTAPMPRWREVLCASCGGHGVVSDYGATGVDFYGAKECDGCLGSGHQYVSGHGAIAAYPGGPFRGRLTRKELSQQTQVADHQS